jgi:hypothetical protein
MVYKSERNLVYLAKAAVHLLKLTAAFELIVPN